MAGNSGRWKIFKASLRAVVSVVWIFVGLTRAAIADDAMTVSSPDGTLTVTLELDKQIPFYSVSQNGKPVIGKSRLGLRFKSGLNLDGGFEVTSSEVSSFDETWVQPWGEKKEIRNNYKELRAVLREASGKQRIMNIVFRVYNDGLGFRYELPKQENLGAVSIMDELTQFQIVEDSVAWHIPAREWNRYEYLYDKTPLEDVVHAHTPMTMRTTSGTHISIHEAALVDYAGMTLKRGRWNTLHANLTPLATGVKVEATAPFHTPWRTIQITSDAVGLLNSHLILNLNEPNKLGDVSWVEPGKYVGIWWEMHLGTSTWGSGEIHGATTERTKRYIDFAAEHGFKGVLVEGWNIGWDDDWYNNGDIFKFTEPYPDFDIKALSEYAVSKGVRLIGHHETSGGISNYESQLSDALDYYRDYGVTSI
ncbi:MAG: glycoside hydrolase family 97 N-terminal domain-containing protein, partial [Kordiimonas sp.]